MIEVTQNMSITIYLAEQMSRSYLSSSVLKFINICSKDTSIKTLYSFLPFPWAVITYTTILHIYCSLNIKL